MIINFEHHTKEISQNEKTYMRYILSRLSQNIGEQSAAKSGDICAAVSKRFNIDFKGARLRKIINYARRNYLTLYPIASTQKGYFIEKDPEKIKLFIESMRQRAREINAVADKVEQKYIISLQSKAAQKTLL